MEVRVRTLDIAGNASPWMSRSWTIAYRDIKTSDTTRTGRWSIVRASHAHGRTLLSSGIDGELFDSPGLHARHVADGQVIGMFGCDVRAGPSRS